MYLKHWVHVRTVHANIFAYTYIQTLVELLLLLVYYAEAEVDLVCLLEVGLHSHDLRESLFSVLQRAIAIVQDANAVPQLRLLRKY
jgi:hypothetical protein